MEGILEVGMEHSLHMPNKLIIRFHHHARPGSGCPKFSILWGVYRGFVYAAMAVGFRALACTGKARPRTPSTYVRIPKIVRMNRQRIKVRAEKRNKKKKKSKENKDQFPPTSSK